MIVEVNGQNVEFPDGMSHTDIESAIKANYLSIKPAKAAKATFGQMFKDEAMTSLPGGVARGLKDVIDTGARGASWLSDQFTGGSRGAQVKAMNDAGDADFKAAQERVGAGLSDVGRVGGQVLATAPVGPVLAAGARFAGAPTAAVNALRTAGFSTGSSPVGLAARAGDLALRSGAGAVVGGASAGSVNFDDAGTGAAIGLVTPGVIQALGKAGGGVANAWRSMRANGDVKGAQALLDVLEAGTQQQRQQVIAALKNSGPILPGSNLTVSQALQKSGAQRPGAQMLERLASQGPGGDTLLNRYAEQGAARTGALASQGAETYQGAARDLSERTGSRIGAILRTQAGDDQSAARTAWEKVYGTAAQNDVRLNLPLDDMSAAMSPLGRGTVGAGSDARALLKEAQAIGLEELPAIKPLTMKASGTPQTLEQAVRSAGGIRKNALSGELSDLGIKGSGTTGLVNNKSGKSADILAQVMHERGFIPDADPATLLSALRNGGGRRAVSFDAPESAFQRMGEAAMGDAPGAELIPRSVPFDEFQRLRRSAGALGAKVGERAGGATEAGVLNNLSSLLTKRADDAVAGLVQGDNLTPEFLARYNTARGMTKQNADLYKGGNNIASILRKPVGQDYTLGGDEITNKLWHGGAGLLDDVSNLKRSLSASNEGPAMDALQKYIMTDAASKTTASGQLASALPKYVENRLPGLLEALSPDQLKSLTSVAADIRNAEAAAAVPGLRGSDTYAKASRALDAGLLDSPSAKTLAKIVSFRGFGGESIRAKMAENTVRSKGELMAGLLADPVRTAKAMEAVQSVHRRSEYGGLLMQGATRAAPVVLSQ